MGEMLIEFSSKMGMLEKSAANYALLIIGAFAVIISFAWKIRMKRLTKQGNTVVANVIDNVLNNSSGRHAFSYSAVLEYEINGIKYTSKSNVGYPKPKYYIGQQLKIYYDSANPNNFMIGGDDKLPAITIVTIVGFILIAANLILLSIFSL